MLRAFPSSHGSWERAGAGQIPRLPTCKLCAFTSCSSAKPRMLPYKDSRGLVPLALVILGRLAEEMSNFNVGTVFKHVLRMEEPPTFFFVVAPDSDQVA